MPALTPSEETLIRTGPPALRYYLAVMPYVLKFQAVVDNPGTTWGDYYQPYSGVVYGAYGDIEGNETAHIYDSTGATYKGRIRVRSADATYITFSANNNIEWADGDQIRVYNVWEPWSRPTNQVIVEDATTYYKDWDIAFTDNNTAFPPKANIAAGWAGYLGSGGTITVHFSGSLCYPMAQGATLSSYAWDIADGVVVAGGVTQTYVNLQFTHAGFRWIKLTVTDSNGKTGTMRVPVWTFGGNYQPVKNFEIKRRSFDVRDGELEVELYETDLGPTDIQEGTQVCLFSREWIKGTEITMEDGDFGAYPAGRRQMRFLGWVLKDTVDWDPEAGTVGFTVGTIGKAADNLPGYGTFLQDVDTAEDWHKLQGLSVRRACHFMLEWHTNLNELVFVEHLAPDKSDPGPDIGGREFTAAPPLKQLEQALLKPRGVFARLGCTRWGGIHIRYDPQELDSTDRDGVEKVTHLFRTDRYNELTIAKTPRYRVNSVWGGGIHYDGSTATPYRARSPGKIGLEAARRDRADHLIITSQGQLNDLLGAYLGELSNPWDPVKPATAWDIWEPALQEYTSLDVTAGENPRGYAFSASDKWIARRVDIKDIQYGAPEVTLELEYLTTPMQGVTVAIPDPPSFPKPEFPGPRPWGPPPDPGLEGKVVICATDYGVIWTADIDQINPTWAITGTTGLAGLDIYLLFQNPQNSRELIAVVNAVNVDSDLGDVYYISDYRNPSEAWVKVLDGGDAYTNSETDETNHSRTQEVDSYFRRGIIKQDGTLILFQAIHTSSADYGLKAAIFTDWKSAPATYSWGDLFVGDNSYWPRYFTNWEIGELAGGGLVLSGENGTGSRSECVRVTTDDNGASWTQTWDGGWIAPYLSPHGGISDLTDYWVFCWLPVNEDAHYAVRWPGGDNDGEVQLNTWEKADINTASTSYGEYGQLLVSDSILYITKAVKREYSIYGKYGDSYIYRAELWPSGWNTVAIPVYATALDNFTGNLSGVNPMNRIIIGNSNPKDVLYPDDSVHLLTGSGSTLANKSGTGVTGVAGLGATVVNRILWDQYED